MIFGHSVLNHLFTLLLLALPLFSPRPHTLDGVGGYEMACGHCRRPRKEILAFNFDQLCWIRGLSSSPKSQGGSKVVLRGSKMAPEIASWDPENSPGRPEAHPGRALALPAPRKAPGSVRAAANCTPTGGGPGGAGTSFASPAHLPPSSTSTLLLRSNLSPRPHMPRRGRRIRDGLRLLPSTPRRNLGLQLRSTGLKAV